MTAEERLNNISECKRIIRNFDYEMRKLLTERDEIDKKIRNCEEQRGRAAMELDADQKAIETMNTPKYKKAIKLHYDEGLTWECVAENINYSLAWLYKHYPLALREFQEAWDKVQEEL